MRKLLVALAVVVLAGVPAVAHAGVRLEYRVPARESGRVAIDVSGHHNDGRLYGGVLRQGGAYIFHRLGPHRHFDRIIAPNSPSLNPDRHLFTYSVRLKVSPDATWENRQMAVLRHGDGDAPGGDYKLELQRNPITHDVSALCVMRDDDGSGVGYIHGPGPQRSLADGRWHTIACSRVAPQQVALTIDGHQAVRDTRGDLGRVRGDVPLMIGCQLTKSGRGFLGQFVGTLDDITITVVRTSVP